MAGFFAGNVPSWLCGGFYGLLCVFSIVTGLMYAGGKKELNPLELSDKLMERYEDPEKRGRFARMMGWVTFAVGLVQGLTAYAFFRAGTLFSIASASVKLKGKFNLFPLLKLGAYLLVLIVLLLAGTRSRFF